MTGETTLEQFLTPSEEPGTVADGTTKPDSTEGSNTIADGPRPVYRFVATDCPTCEADTDRLWRVAETDEWTCPTCTDWDP